MRRKAKQFQTIMKPMLFLNLEIWSSVKMSKFVTILFLVYIKCGKSRSSKGMRKEWNVKLSIQSLAKAYPLNWEILIIPMSEKIASFICEGNLLIVIITWFSTIKSRFFVLSTTATSRDTSYALNRNWAERAWVWIKVAWPNSVCKSCRVIVVSVWLLCYSAMSC